MLQKLCVCFVVLLFSYTAFAQVSKALPDLRNPISIKTIPAALYIQQLSPICKAERYIQKKAGVPLYFRVGGKDYVDYLEGKPNAAKKW